MEVPQITKFIVVFPLTVALLCFTIATGCAERTIQLPSGNYDFSITTHHGKITIPVRLETKLQGRFSYYDQTDVAMVVESHLDILRGKFVGYTREIYPVDYEGKMSEGTIVLALTTFKPRSGEISTVHLKGWIKNHSASETASFFTNDHKDDELPWVLTKRQD